MAVRQHHNNTKAQQLNNHNHNVILTMDQIQQVSKGLKKCKRFRINNMGKNSNLKIELRLHNNLNQVKSQVTFKRFYRIKRYRIDNQPKNQIVSISKMCMEVLMVFAQQIVVQEVDQAKPQDIVKVWVLIEILYAK